MKIPEHLIPILTMIEPTKDWEIMTINDWTKHLIVANPATIKYLPMELLDGHQTSRILRPFPEKANDANLDWDKLNGEDWCWLLQEQPHFFVHLDDWDKLSGENWSWLLRIQTHFFVHLDDWDKLSGEDWSCLLQVQPQFAIHRKP